MALCERSFFCPLIGISSVCNSAVPNPLIIWLGGLNSNGERSLPKIILDFANKKNYAILTPSFICDNDDDFMQQRSYQYPSAWSGRALRNMISSAKSQGLNSSKLYMVGHIAGAQFVARYSLIHPEEVAACAILSSGGRIELESNSGVKYFVAVGTMDDKFRIDNAEIFAQSARKHGVPVIYNRYRTGHKFVDSEIKDVTDFFEKVRKGNM